MGSELQGTVFYSVSLTVSDQLLGSSGVWCSSGNLRYWTEQLPYTFWLCRAGEWHKAGGGEAAKKVSWEKVWELNITSLWKFVDDRRLFKTHFTIDKIWMLANKKITRMKFQFWQHFDQSQIMFSFH